MIGYYGNCLGFDFWMNIVYVNIFNFLFYMMDVNVFIVFVFGGGVYRKFFWGLLGCLIYGFRVNE